MYKKIVYFSSLLWICLAGNIQAETIAADLLVYSVENQHAAAPYLSRILVSDDMLRMDEVGDDRMQGYLLFDRKQRLVLSVDPETRSVMVIGPPSGDAAADSTVTLEIDSRSLDEAPLFAGKKPRQHSFHVQGAECFNIVSIEGEMPRAMDALREMNSVLSERHRRVLGSAADAQQDCKFLVDAYRPGIEYSMGLLLTLMNGGENHQLVDVKQAMPVDAVLFEEPPEYKRFPMP